MSYRASAILICLSLSLVAAEQPSTSQPLRQATSEAGPMAASALSSNVMVALSLGPVSSPSLFNGAYTIAVPATATRLETSLSCNADVSLYMRYGQDVAFVGQTLATDFGSVTHTGREGIALTGTNLKSGTYYIAFGLLSTFTQATCYLTSVYTSVVPTNALAASQFVSGGGWSTAIFVTNVSTVAETFTIKILGDDGAPLRVPFLQAGTTDSIAGTLQPGETQVFETSDSGSALSQGWAAVIPATNTAERISGFAVFRNRTPGRADFEAVVSLTGVVDRKFIMLYDNANGFESGAAFANPSPEPVTLQAETRDANGQTIEVDSFPIPPLGHIALILSQSIPASAGKRGTVLFTITGPSVTVLGLRFSPAGPFTSFPAFPQSIF